MEIGDKVMHKWQRSNKHLSLFDPNPYVITHKKGNMMTGTRSDKTMTRNSRFFKIINDECYERALELSKSKPKQLLEQAMTILIPKHNILVPQSPVANNIQAKPRLVPEIPARQRKATVLVPQIPERPIRERHQTVTFDEHRNTSTTTMSNVTRNK